MVTAQDSLNVTMLFNWDDPSIPANGFFGNQYNEIWGFEQNGREYAVIGSCNGTHIFDVTVPASSVEVEFIPGNDNGSHIVHRDYHDHNGYLYIVADEGSSTLQIVDLSGLPASATVVYDSNALIRTAHNIYIDTAANRLYSCGNFDSSPAFNDLRILDISNPTSPTLLADYNGIDYYHDITVYGDTAIGHNGYFGLSIVDFTNPTSPNVISTLETYPFQGYNHSGYHTEDKQWYYLADENHGYDMKVIDISDITSPTITSTFGSYIDPNSIPHNLITEGDFLYVSYYHDGLYIFDISNPATPTMTGFYDTSTMPHNTDYVGAWGVYPYLPSGVVLVSDMQNGLYVLDPSMALSIDEADDPVSFSVFPNPVNDVLNVRTLINFNDPLDYVLMDVSGKTHAVGMLSPGFLNVTAIQMDQNLSSGIYFLNIVGADFMETIKVVKE